MKPSKREDEKYVRARERMRQRLMQQQDERRRTRRISEELEDREELFSRRRRERMAGRQGQEETCNRPTANLGGTNEAPSTHPTFDLCDSSSEDSDQQSTTSHRQGDAGSDIDLGEFDEMNSTSDVSMLSDEEFLSAHSPQQSANHPRGPSPNVQRHLEILHDEHREGDMIHEYHQLRVMVHIIRPAEATTPRPEPMVEEPTASPPRSPSQMANIHDHRKHTASTQTTTITSTTETGTNTTPENTSEILKDFLDSEILNLSADSTTMEVEEDGPGANVVEQPQPTIQHLPPPGKPASEIMRQLLEPVQVDEAGGQGADGYVEVPESEWPESIRQQITNIQARSHRGRHHWHEDGWRYRIILRRNCPARVTKAKILPERKGEM